MFNQCVCVSLLFCMCLCSEVSSWRTGTSSAHLWSSSASCCSLITIEPLLCKQGSFCIMLSLVESLDYFDQQSGFFNFIIIISRLLLFFVSSPTKHLQSSSVYLSIRWSDVFACVITFVSPSRTFSFQRNIYSISRVNLQKSQKKKCVTSVQSCFIQPQWSLLMR